MLRIVAQDERSQMRNRELAVRAVRRDDARRPAPAAPAAAGHPAVRAAKERRLAGKRIAGKTKRLRKPPGGGEE